jgi:hypothetical protein
MRLQGTVQIIVRGIRQRAGFEELKRMASNGHYGQAAFNLHTHHAEEKFCQNRAG